MNRYAALFALLAAACTTSRPAAPDYGKVERLAFNRAAAELALPLFWREDTNQDQKLDPAELDSYWGLTDTERSQWVTPQGFSQAFANAYADIVARQNFGAPKTADPAEARRQELLKQELNEGRLTLLRTDLSNAKPHEKEFARHILKAAGLVERIFRAQCGSLAFADQIPATDTRSRMVYFLNNGPWCSAPTTESDKDCNALSSRPERLSGLYPAALQADKGFCKKLHEREDKEQIINQFAGLVDTGNGNLDPTPYNELYANEMSAVAKELMAAAELFPAGEEEALKAYLKAAAQAFLDNDWFKADEAWAKMNAENSAWYLRIGPDEVYFEPCSEKAGFHVSFARINPGSLAWQKRLEPVKNDMEQVLASKAGKPYKARNVAFHLPDFIDMVVNAGDARSPRGATIGQSLPNWGPVANEGRGRTVVMTNFYTDPDSRSAWRTQVESLFCSEAMATVKDNQEPQLMSTVLHEAAHNLGPSHEYAVGGKVDDVIFGGPLASTMEELKAQTAALFLADWLQQKGIVDQAMVREAHTYDITWAMGHIARGMYTADQHPKPYSQLAAIQLGYLMDKGAIAWNPQTRAANGKDMGCFTLKLDEFPKAIDVLTAEVFGIKARGDLLAAQAIKETYVDAQGPFADLRAIIADRWLRSPQASFVYAIVL